MGANPDYRAPIACPYGCNPGNCITVLSHETTCLGWFRGPDPNGHTERAVCNTCDRPFTRRWNLARKVTRYQDEKGKVVAGNPEQQL